MTKKEILDGMTIRELQNVILQKQQEEAMKKYGTKRETPFKMKEVKTLNIKADSTGSLFHVVIADGSEGWEAIVEVDHNIDYGGNLEKLVENHIVNFIIENEYYENGDIEDITVNGLCHYGKSMFKISKNDSKK